MFFLSLTRSRLGSYHIDANAGVLFKLDGQKLNQRYKGGSVDYWGPGWNKDEMEDRLFADTDSIPAKPYITQIDIHGIDTEKPDRVDAWAYKVYIWAKKNKVPVNVYSKDQADAFRTNNTAKTMTHQQIMQAGNESIRLAKEFGPMRARRRLTGYRLPMLLSVANQLDLSKLSSKERDVARALAYKDRDIYSSIESDVHNGTHSTSVRTLSQMMKKFKAKDLTSFLNRVGEIYLEQFKEEEKAENLSRAQRAYDQNKEFIDHVNDVLAGQTEFDKERFSHISHPRYTAEQAVRTLYVLGKLKNKNAVTPSGWADPMFVEIYFSN